jgi:hypothetical protein
MTRGKLLVVTLGILASLILLTACNSDNSNGSLASATLNNKAGRVTLQADPEKIVIDLNDPNTPIDQDSGEAYGETMLMAFIVDDMGTPEPDVEVVFTTTGGTLASESMPVLTDQNGAATDTLRVLESDPDSIDVTATAGEDSDTGTVTKIVIQPNEPPTADAGMDQEVECGDPATLDGSGSSDPDSTEGTNDDIVLFEWVEGDIILGEGETLVVDLSLGAHTITLQVTDSMGATDTDEVVVTVVDTTPPAVTIEMSPSEIWPPNHKMVEVVATLHIDDCTADGAEPPTVMLVSVTSNEPANDRGDGNTEPDIMGAEAGTEDYHFMVRAERAGGGSGRVYTVTYLVTDGMGNSTETSAELRVPHDQGH